MKTTNTGQQCDGVPPQLVSNLGEGEYSKMTPTVFLDEEARQLDRLQD